MKKKTIFILAVILLIIVTFSIVITTGNKSTYMQYKEFYENLEEGNISKVIIEDNKIEFNKKDDTNLFYTENPNSSNLKEKILLNGIEVEEESSEKFVNILADGIFFVFFIGLFGIGGIKLLELKHKTFKVVKNTNVTFEDIAGMTDLKNEMIKIVDVLKDPKKYKEIGIRQTKGIILEGNPGNGKTMFAKALANEAKVNFIATKGADFQSAMMSMGSRKIKTLFKKARKHKPCIIFIDEFDGIGEKRNYAGTGVDKENNRIITAMLNEMDGFESGDGILVIAATNSYASLDPALIRPGRFDLKFNIPNPDTETRLKLIEMYTAKKKLSDEIDKNKLADAFDNLSCSAIETILNEASMIAITESRPNILIDDIIIAGRKTNCNINIKKLRR